jgi:hypothetical protein
MACSAPFDQFAMHNEDFVDMILKTPSPNTFFNDLIPKADYPHGIGIERTIFTAGRSLPTSNTPDFERVTLTDGDTYVGSCLTDYNLVHNGMFAKTYVPEKFGWKSDVICSDDLIYSWQVNSFIPIYVENLAKNARWTIHFRYKSIYDHLVPKVVVCPDGAEEFWMDDGGTGLPGTAPDLTLPRSLGELTQDILDEVNMQLVYQGAEIDPQDGGWITYGNEGPLWTLDIDAKLSAQIFKNNAERRTDLRYAFEGAKDQSPLVRRLMAARQLGNFRHLPNPYATRYNYVNGAYVEVDTWEVDATATKGEPTKMKPTDAWLNATHIGTRVLSQNVFTSELIRPVNAAGGLTFPQKSYAGEWKFVVGGNNIQATGGTLCEDPFMKLGRHYAEFHHAPRPVKPRHGVLILSRRCESEYECVTCGS